MCVGPIKNSNDVVHREKMNVPAMDPKLGTDVDDDRVGRKVELSPVAAGTSTDELQDRVLWEGCMLAAAAEACS